jgi:integrase
MRGKETGQSHNMWKFAVYSGVRHGELAARAWEDVDLENGTVQIRRNLTVLGTFGPPKTEAGNRTIALLEPAIEALRAQRALTALQPKTGIVFYHREYGLTEKQQVRFVFYAAYAKRRAETLLFSVEHRGALERRCKTCWNSAA